MNDLFKKHVFVTDFIHGPFMIVVRNLEDTSDDSFPLVVGPPEGYANKEAALAYIESYSRRTKPYLGLHFSVVQQCSEGSFHMFCSWED